MDKNREHKKDLLYNVSMYYLKSFNKEKRALSFVNTPFFEGNVIFGLDIKNKMRPLSFNKIQKNKAIDPVDPRLFKKLLFSNENQFIAFSNQSTFDELSPVLEMLTNFQFDEDKIIKLTLCNSCLDKSKFTLLEGRSTSISHKDQKICPDCALKIVLRRASSIGIIPRDNISPKLKNFFNHMLYKFKDVEKIIKAFTTDFNPSANKVITLYDIEKNPTISKKYLDYKIDRLDVPSKFKDILLKDIKISTLLPIQAISVENGLISEKKNQLIMAPTSGGKTLIGELSGISKVLENKNLKMLYLVPIVALANIRTNEFTTKYKRLNLKIVKRIGESILDKNRNDNLEELKDADIIIATYEAIDFILRSGNKNKLGNIGTIVIDEIQTLIDPDRGFLLDGFIARLKTIFQGGQYLYLSATIGEPETLAKKLNCMLIRYNNRPVPIERHLLLCLNNLQKEKYIVNLIRSTFSNKSKYGYRGQSIVFTNTRKKCESIVNNLKNKGINVRAYHSGLTHEERKIVELEFQSQKIMG
ncbi:MAG: DEAD/DEAH box helicase, partial [Promethearchaeota archaeon]